MIDLRRLGEPPYREGFLKKGFSPAALEQLVARNEERLRLRGAVEQLRARHNAASRRIGKATAAERP
ncbi:MAG TPA: hypothetical protein VKY15_06550, partial [Acidimicrobiales bacterium]|nr:hypothetical protein [Acidimicrobiales bacterium]